MKSLVEMMEEAKPLEEQAIAALKRYHIAQAADRPPEELEKLRAEAEYAFKTFSEYQLKATGFQTPTHH